MLAAVTVLMGVALLPACARGAADDGRLTVVANFYPVFEAAREVGGVRVVVTNLTPAGAEPHDLELSPRDVDEILDANVVVYMGFGFQPAVEDAVKGRHDGVTVDLLQSLESELRRSGEKESLTGGRDPHVWLDPVLMGQMVDRIVAALAHGDPAGRSVFERDAAAYRSDIEALDQRYRAGLADCDRRVIVTSHAAFGYLAARYHLVQQSIAGVSPEAEPDPRRLAGLADLVRRDGVTTIFTEELVSPRVAETLAREAGVKTAVLNPLEGLTAAEQARGETYVSVMDRNLATLRSALGCR